MNDLVASIAQDLSEQIAEIYGHREPADEYFDPVIVVFGKKPSRADAVKVLRERVPQFAKKLSEWLEMDVSEASARDMLHSALVNFYGSDI
jgi:hypothetical protein